MTRNSLGTKILVGAGLAVAFALTLSSAAPAQVTEKSLSLGTAPLVIVDNVNGPIHVVGDGGAQVRFTATESNPDHASDVHLDVTQTADSVKLYVDGPFRCGDEGTRRCDHWSDDWDDASHRVRFDFELHVPANARLDLKTVNHGDIEVESVAGDYTIHNINGGVDIEQMGGSGTANTINGALKASFRTNPRGPSDFGSLNGAVSLYFQPSLNANLTYKTLNGSVYSDFPVTPVASNLPTTESRDGHMIVFRRGRTTAARIGAGGPVFALHTLNGNIYIHQAK